MFDPVMRDLDRHLSSVESAERLSEAAIDWITGGDAEDYFDEDEWPTVQRLADDGWSSWDEQKLWDDAVDRFVEVHHSY